MAVRAGDAIGRSAHWSDREVNEDAFTTAYGLLIFGFLLAVIGVVRWLKI